MARRNNSARDKNISPEATELIPYKTENGMGLIEVSFNDETIWLSLNQIAMLFNRNKSVISRHISNIYEEKELDRISTVAKNATVQIERNREVRREIEFYNLDVVISIGYRVKSQRGVQFRIWATKILKERLLQKYGASHQKDKELVRVIKLIEGITEGKELAKDEAVGLLKVITDYTYALDLLDDFDYRRIQIEETTVKEKFSITYGKAVKVIKELKSKFGSSSLFGKEKDESLKSSIGNIYQTHGGRDLYPSLEEKAAHLLYFLIKNHSFIDGNKRIGASIFLWYLKENKLLYRSDGSKRIADNALVALTLMIAESNPKEKETIVKVIVNLINKSN